MHPTTKAARQLDLPLADAQAAYAERRNDVLRACKLRDADLHLRDLMLMVFHFTEGGTRGEVVKTYAQLAERSQWGLWCETSKARRTVAEAISKGILSVREQRRYDGSQAGNAYTIDWAGIRQIIGHVTPLETKKPPVSADVAGAQPPVAGALGGVAGAQPPAHPEHLLKEYPSCFLNKKNVVVNDVTFAWKWEEARELAKQTDAILSLKATPEWRDLIMAAALMALHDFDRLWLIEAAKVLHSSKPDTSRLKYFKGVLRNSLVGLGFCDESSLNTVWGASFGPAIREVKRRYAAQESGDSKSLAPQEAIHETEVKLPNPPTDEALAALKRALEASRRRRSLAHQEAAP
jgi:hypothetical protein